MSVASNPSFSANKRKAWKSKNRRVYSSGFFLFKVLAFAKCLKREIGTKSLFLRKKKPTTKVVGFLFPKF